MFRVEKLKSVYAKTLESDTHKNSVKIVGNNDPNEFCILPEVLTKGYLQDIKTMKVYEDDIWIITFPKAGTTWTQACVSLSINEFIPVKIKNKF